MSARTQFLAALALLAGVALSGCARQNSTADTDDTAARPAAAPAATQAACACEDEPVVDPPLLAFLSLARAAHHEADLAMADGDRAKAIAALGRVTAATWTGKKPPELVEVTADTFARIADLQSEAGQFDDASRAVDAGLALATEPTHYRGRLFELRGVVEQRREKALKDKGDKEGAAKAHQIALDAFAQAIDIQDDVIARMMKLKDNEKDKGGK
ncbi:MAG: hypothetical protein U0441_00515 [Polyangiaceae bacterium]